MRFLDICLSWISAKLALIQSKRHLLHNSFNALLANSIVFYNILAQSCAEIKILRWFLDEQVTYVFRLFAFAFFSFSFLFAAVIGSLLGLLAVKKLLRKCHQDEQI